MLWIVISNVVESKRNPRLLVLLLLLMTTGTTATSCCHSCIARFLACDRRQSDGLFYVCFFHDNRRESAKKATSTAKKAVFDFVGRFCQEEGSLPLLGTLVVLEHKDTDWRPIGCSL